MPEIITTKDKLAKAKEDLKARISALKPDLEKIVHWKNKFVELHPEYNNKSDLDLITRIHAGRITNSEITNQLEAFVQDNKTQK